MSNNEQTMIVDKLDAIARQVAYLTERQRAQEELFAEMMPIARGAMAQLVERLDDLDRKGYFAFAQELLGVGQRVVEGFSPADVRQLGDAVVTILDTVRRLTQPEVLQVAAEASAAMQDADHVKPIGILGVVRASRNDDVQKGIALLVEVLKRIGHGVNAAATKQLEAGGKSQKLAELLGPRRGNAPARPQLPAPAPRAAAPAPRPAPAAAPACATPSQLASAPLAGWTREVAATIAAGEQVALTGAHWTIIEAARADYAATQASPNIRRLTQVANVTTKDLYALFPKAPGRTIAKIAGLPKPAGCL